MPLIDWLSANWIELTATILGLAGIGLQIKQNYWYWLTSILMVLMYIYVFYTTKFYADMSFQVYYLVVSIYGWYYWIKSERRPNKNRTKTEQENTAKMVVKQLTKKQILISIGISVAFFVGIYFILKIFTDSDVPAGDAFTTALSITATWLLAKKYIENWIFWIIADTVSAGLYFYKELYPTFILFAVLTFLAIIGYGHWKKALNTQQ